MHMLSLPLMLVIAACNFLLPTDNSPVPENPTENTRIAASSEIFFIEQDWDKATSLAKEQNKLIFLDLYATWCGPCKMLKKNTFADQEVAGFFNENFINITVDAEKGLGPKLAKTYRISGYPTLIITNHKGEPVLYTMGYLNAKQIIDFAKQAIEKKDKS